MWLTRAPRQMFIATRPADLRRSYDGLAAMVEGFYPEGSMSGDLFVFINKRRTQLKMLYYHQGGYCLWSKRLERGTFAKLASADNKLALNSAQLQCLIDGVYWQEKRQNKRLNWLNLL